MVHPKRVKLTIMHNFIAQKSFNDDTSWYLVGKLVLYASNNVGNREDR